MKDGNELLIKNINVYAEDKTIPNGFIWIQDKTIKEIGDADSLNEKTISDSIPIINGEGLNAIPGFIDGHIHGANGSDVMDATTEALDTMAQVLPAEGTTSFLATTITQSKENIDNALKNIAAYQDKAGYAEIVGVHLEGPFIEERKAGAQPREYILEPAIDQFNKWQRLANNAIKTITLAPEKDEDGAFIRYLYDQGINVSAGHTDAGVEDMKKAVQYGVRQVTHLCNAMSGIHHRDIGVAGSALLFEEIKSELIADGIHVSPEMIQLIYKNVGSEGLLLITDALRAKCLNSGTYDLGGQDVTVTESSARLSDDTLAGSILKMYNGAQNMMTIAGAGLRNVIEMGAANPAKQINMFDRKGSLRAGKDADVLLVDNELNISYTICRGVVAFKEENGK